ncbi:MAG TPA: protein-methionine-sulfoxide reductase catalytic subunit MsrP [Candidatus Dormibacteraeota bacterium]|nr:protein-methionine-sulfoxide reductase catalytic subunit MsrP [Candidatus Dormibacteraeota bacterium]
MFEKRPQDLKYSDVTPREVYLNRRKLLIGMGIAGGVALAGGGVASLMTPSARTFASTKLPGVVPGPYSTTEKVTPEQIVTTYNNYYEFGTEKDDPSKNAQKFVTSPWSVSVGGEVAKPRKFSMDEILKLAPLEERIYRHRCVEAWSIVVPWIGFSFNKLAKLVEPTSKARYVAFQTYFNKTQMPLWYRAGIQLPYVEGLRMDEAMHPLTLLTVGMYGETLPNQDGAPVRMVIPWKYGFKSIKSLVKITFVKDQPPTTWNMTNSHEYGFYSNVNPHVDHPRWSQAKEVRLPGFFKNRATLMFNGYSDQVASMYAGMDLRKYF